MVKVIRQALTKYNFSSKAIKASFWYAMGNILQKGVGFFATPIYTRLLSKSEFGIVNVYNSWITIISIFATLELATGVYNKAMIKYEDDRDGYTTSSLFLSELSSALLFIVYIAGYPLWNNILGLDTGLVVLIFVQIIFNIPVSLWSIRKRFEYEYKGVVFVSVISAIGGSCLSVLLIINFPDYHIYARILGGIIVNAIINIIIAGLLIHKSRLFASMKYWRYALKFNIPLIPHYLSQQVLDQADRIMINSICGSSEVGLYSLAYQVAIGIKIIINSIHGAFVPWTFQKIRKGELKIIGKRALQLEILIGLLSVLFSLFAPEMVLILGGKNYYEAVYIIPPVAISMVYITIYSFFGNIEFYLEKTTFTMIASIIVAVINVALNNIFIERYGYIAAGYTTLFCYLLYALFHYLFMVHICRKERLSNPYNGKLMWGVAIVLTVACIILSFLYIYFWIRYVIIGVLFASIIIFMKRRLLFDKS